MKLKANWYDSTGLFPFFSPNEERSSKRPYEAIPIGSNIIVEGMEMGIMKADKTGYSTFFSAENSKPAPPERPAAGQ